MGARGTEASAIVCRRKESPSSQPLATRVGAPPQVFGGVLLPPTAKTAKMVPLSTRVGALRGLRQRALAGAKRLLVHDDPSPRPLLGGEGGVPAGRKLGVGPAEERLG